MQKMEVLKADITTVKVDAIVNFSEIYEFEIGNAKMTDAYQLPYDFIIHTVGPVWQGGNQGESDLLKKCYENVLKLASKYRLESIAFPCTSTNGFPKEMACEIAISTVANFLKLASSLKKVIFVCYDDDFKIYNNTLENK